MMKKISSHLSLLILICGFLMQSGMSYSQNLDKTFDSMVTEEYPAGEPGVAILIAKDDEVIYRTASGMANLELDIPLAPEMVFEIGSVTKQFTAVSILMLVEQGKISLEDDITKYIEDYPTHGYSITIHQLLTHTSGIKSYTSMEEWPPIWRNDLEPMELVDFFKNQPMDFAPGEEFRYNNSAYFLLGPIIEIASGLSYAQFLEENIFKPLKMVNSSYGSHSRIIHNRASAYQKGDDFKNAEFLSLTQPGAAGSIMSTVDDLFLWQQAIRGNALVSAESIEKAFTNYQLNDGSNINYGYGWMMNEINGSATLEHGGGIFGYTCNGIYLPEENVYVIALTNRDDKSPALLTTKMAAAAIGKPYPAKDAGVKVQENILKTYTGVYDFDDGSTRYITFDDGQLHSQRKGSQLFELFALSETKFRYVGSLASIAFSVSDTSISASFQNRMYTVTGFKTDKALPIRTEIIVEASIMKTYEGEYEIQPGFSIVVTLEDGHLRTQATGQEKFEVFPESETKFFLKEVDAQIEFQKNDSGAVNELILYQGGQEIHAPKVK